MLFRFIQYIQPTHYFQLYKKDGTAIFPIPTALPEALQAQLDIDPYYESSIAAEYDLSWQAIQKGYIGNAPTYSTLQNLPIVDEYRFIRKYFKKLWVYYIMLLRLMQFRNPVTEWKGFWKSRGKKENAGIISPILYPDWDTFDSSLVRQNPLVSVIIPTLNRYEYLIDVIRDLEKQAYSNFEVLIVDQTEQFQEQFYTQFNIPLRVFRQEEKALWLARNFAIQESKGNLYLLFDDDSRVATDWILNHVKCLDFFNADISSGVSISIVGAKVPDNYRFFRVSDQLDTGNVLIKRAVFEKIGLFDRQFEKQRMGDGEFGLRAHVSGFLNVSNPFADRLHLKVSSGGLRQMGSWDGFRPKNWLGPRPIPSVIYFYRRYYGTRRTLWSLLKSVPPSIIPYRFKKNKKMMILGIFISVLLLPLVGIQVVRSWKLAGQKIKQGPLISELK